MTLTIEDEETASLVADLAARRGVTTDDAVKLAVRAELGRSGEATSLRERLAAWREANPMPPPTGLAADKAFFDELSGES